MFISFKKFVSNNVFGYFALTYVALSAFVLAMDSWPYSAVHTKLIATCINSISTLAWIMHSFLRYVSEYRTRPLPPADHSKLHRIYIGMPVHLLALVFFTDFIHNNDTFVASALMMDVAVCISSSVLLMRNELNKNGL